MSGYSERHLRDDAPDLPVPDGVEEAGSLRAVLTAWGFDSNLERPRPHGRPDQIQVQKTKHGDRLVLLRSGRWLAAAPSLKALVVACRTIYAKVGERGVSLVELMVVVMLMAAAFGVSWPLVGTLWRDLTVRAELRQLRAPIAACRSNVWEWAQPVLVELDGTGLRCGTERWAPADPSGWSIPSRSWQFTTPFAGTAPLQAPIDLATPGGLATLTVRGSGAVRIDGP